MTIDTQEDTGTEIVPISSADAKAYNLIISTLEWMSENGCYNYTEACRQLCPEHLSWKTYESNLYRAFQRPYVQLKLAENQQNLDTIMVQMYDQGWLGVVRHQFAIAMGRDGTARDAVAAAKFLAEQRESLLERVGDAGEGDEKSAARTALEMFAMAPGAVGRFRRKRTKKTRQGDVTEEIEVEVPSKAAFTSPESQ